jgi:predicted ribosome quality control (RQC) complex YloA/Tae2 family protein
MSKGGKKETLLIESGIRIHTTEFIKNKKDLPSGFSMKLRKHLRTKKLTSIRQLGMDRVIDLQFGKDEFAAHIIVELYAQGNIILTDENYTILSLLRSYTLDGAPVVEDGEQGPVRCAVKEKYPFSAAANLTEDSIMTDPAEVKRLIDEQFKKSEDAAAAALEAATKEEDIKDTKDTKDNKPKKGGGPTRKTQKGGGK